MAKERKKRIEYAEDVVDVDAIREEVENEEEELEEDRDIEGNGNCTGVHTLPADQSDGHHEMTSEEIDAFERRELAKKVPGFGHLFHVDEEYLSEACRLPKQAILGFAARDMQQGVLDSKRKKSAWDLFKFPYMRYTISEDGKGRDEDLTALHITDDERQAAAQGGLHD